MSEYIVQRVKTNPHVPEIIIGSIAIPFFGNINKSKIGTLGINPSRNEFLKENTIIELEASYRRFHTLKSLGVVNNESLTKSQVEKVLDSCLNYFSVNPYRKWFDQIENNILQKLAVSYYNGTVCHLDIVQWATNPIWRNLDEPIKFELIKNDIKFLSKQLDKERIEFLLINGIGATNIFTSYFKPKLLEKDRITIGTKTCNIHSYEMLHAEKKINVIAWSNNLQSTFGITNEMKNEIGNWVKQKQ